MGGDHVIARYPGGYRSLVVLQLYDLANLGQAPRVLGDLPRLLIGEIQLASVLLFPYGQYYGGRLLVAHRHIHAQQILGVLDAGPPVPPRPPQKIQLEIIPHQLRAPPGAEAVLRVQQRLYGVYVHPLGAGAAVAYVRIGLKLVGKIAVPQYAPLQVFVVLGAILRAAVQGHLGGEGIGIIHPGDIAHQVVADMGRVGGHRARLGIDIHALDAEQLIADDPGRRALLDGVRGAIQRLRQGKGQCLLGHPAGYLAALDLVPARPLLHHRHLDSRLQGGLAPSLFRLGVHAPLGLGGRVQHGPHLHRRHYLTIQDFRRGAHPAQALEHVAPLDMLPAAQVIEGMLQGHRAHAPGDFLVPTGKGRQRAAQAGGGKVLRPFVIYVYFAHYSHLQLGCTTTWLTPPLQLIREPPGPSTGHTSSFKVMATGVLAPDT